MASSTPEARHRHRCRNRGVLGEIRHALILTWHDWITGQVVSLSHLENRLNHVHSSIAQIGISQTSIRAAIWICIFRTILAGDLQELEVLVSLVTSNSFSFGTFLLLDEVGKEVQRTFNLLSASLFFKFHL